MHTGSESVVRLCSATSGRSTQPDENCSPTRIASPFPSPDQLPRESRPGPSTSCRVNTRYYTAEEIAARTKHADEVKRGMETKSPTKRKFDLLELDLAHSEVEFRHRFCLSGYGNVDRPFCACRVRAGGAGFETADRQYRLAVRLQVTCSVYEHHVECFSSPRTEESGNITPFEFFHRRSTTMVGRASPGEKQDLRSSVGVSNLDTLNRLGTSCVGHQPEPSPTTTFGRHLRSVKPENKV